MNEKDFRWLIEAPGQNYLAVRKMQRAPYTFHWTRDHDAALAFKSADQAESVMMAVRELCPELFGFARTLGEAHPVEHGWMATA